MTTPPDNALLRVKVFWHLMLTTCCSPVLDQPSFSVSPWLPPIRWLFGHPGDTRKESISIRYLSSKRSFVSYNLRQAKQPTVSFNSPPAVLSAQWAGCILWRPPLESQLAVPPCWGRRAGHLSALPNMSPSWGRRGTKRCKWLQSRGDVPSLYALHYHNISSTVIRKGSWWKLIIRKSPLLNLSTNGWR